MGWMDKMKNLIGIEDEYDDEFYDDDYYDQYEESYLDSEDEYKTDTDHEDLNTSHREPVNSSSKTSKIVSVGNAGKSSNSMKISIQEPLTYDDGPGILDDIASGKTVVLNLEMLEVDKKRQIFDFVSGGIYALHGNIQKVTKDIYVIAPTGVEINGNIADTVSQKSMYQL